MPSERLKDYVDKYGDLRRRVLRNALYAAAVSVGLALLSRTPEISLNLSKVTKDVVAPGELHIGYIVVFGQSVILILFCYFYLSLQDAVSFRKAIYDALLP